MSNDQKARDIVNKACKLHKEFANKMIDEFGFFSPTIHINSVVRKMINEFEELTGKDWDIAASDYLDK